MDIVDSGINLALTDVARATNGFTTYSGNFTDCAGHGTHVAGIIGGLHYGVAKNANLINVRILSCDATGTLSAMLSGLDYIKTNVGSRANKSIVNLSLATALSSTLNAAVANLIALGVFVVAAVGNSGGAACSVSPASQAGTVAVASTDSFDRRPAFSNFGPCVDIFAPGVGIDGPDAMVRGVHGLSLTTWD